LANTEKNIISLNIKVGGLVQGVGFRPFIFRLASRYDLKGWVANTTEGVEIRIEGDKKDTGAFVEALCSEAPPVSHISEMTAEHADVEGFSDFTVVTSRDNSSLTSEISPDIAVCDECLADLKMQPHRINYPFINCTSCGPRFSIIKDFPYDRAKTTMADFEMCPVCQAEYIDAGNRRFHAEPVACNNCGPVYALHINGSVICDFSRIMGEMKTLLDKGETIAVKGIGGYHLMCDASDEKAVSRLRNSKRREGKPFAVMFRDIEAVREYAFVSLQEEKMLLSWQRPVVILKIRKQLAESVSISLGTIGAFLPYMPFHHILFENIPQKAVVLTSGNISDDPVIKDDDAALSKLSAIAGAVLTYNREIYNRTDDSVLRIISGKTSFIRRSRGFVPLPVKLALDVDRIFAAGAELVNCFCLGRGKKAYLSQHIGDLKNHATFEFYKESAERFKKIFRIEPQTVAADMHPDYLSTRYAMSTGLELVRVQHHHAHIASCMAEHRIEDKVIGLAFDGTGYGSDGNTWGSEFMICDFENFERYSHFSWMPMPGGDRAAEEPWRMALSLLHQAFGKDFIELGLPVIRHIPGDKIARIADALAKNINCPLSSGAGRLFDAVAAITGICMEALHHAEAPMRLEAATDPSEKGSYGYTADGTISFLPAIREICMDVQAGVHSSVMAARFHNTVVNASAEMTLKASRDSGINRVVLSGGTFQNKYLTEKLVARLRSHRLEVYTHTKVPCNDGGLALGQLAIAGYRNSH
jgi:hydrogenase maturation protein HypF